MYVHMYSSCVVLSQKSSSDFRENGESTPAPIMLHRVQSLDVGLVQLLEPIVVNHTKEKELEIDLEPHGLYRKHTSGQMQIFRDGSIRLKIGRRVMIRHICTSRSSQGRCVP